MTRTVRYTAFVILINDQRRSLAKQLRCMLYNKTKLKIYSNVHIAVVMTDGPSFFRCSGRCRYSHEDPSSGCLLVVLALSKIVLSGRKSRSEQ